VLGPYVDPEEYTSWEKLNIRAFSNYGTIYIRSEGLNRTGYLDSIGQPDDAHKRFARTPFF